MTDRNARFARTRDLRDLRTPPYGLFLGYHGFPRRPLLSDRQAHALVVAPNGAGKGVGVLMQNALAWPTSMIVLDPKGEFREQTLHWRAQYQECFTWGPTTFSSRWNPIAEIAALDPSAQMEEAMRLASAFTASTGGSSGGNDKFWTTEGQSVLAHAFLWAATCNPERPASLAHVYDLLCRPDDLDAVFRSLEHSTHPTLAAWAASQQRQNNKSGADILSTARSYLRSFASGPVRDAIAASDLTYAQLLQPGTTLYLHATATDFSTHGSLLIAFLEGFISRALTTTTALAEPLLMLLDEFSLLPEFPSMRTLLTLSRGYNIRILVVLQDLSLVKPDLRNLLLSNAHDQLFFAATDTATTEYLSKRLGTVDRKSISRSRNRSGTSRTESKRREELLAPHQIRAMKKSLLFHGNAPPARVTLRPYYKDKRFIPRLGVVLPPTPTPIKQVPLAGFLPDATPPAAPSHYGPPAHLDLAPPPGDDLDALDDLDAFLDEPDPSTDPSK